MRGKGITRFYVHTAAVETFLGTSGYGVDLFATAITVPCFADDKVQNVRNTIGETVVSMTTIYASTDWASTFLSNSRVTVNGRQSRVIVTNTNDSGPLNLPDHIAVNLE